MGKILLIFVTWFFIISAIMVLGLEFNRLLNNDYSFLRGMLLNLYSSACFTNGYIILIIKKEK